jgi:hypothetical protein
MVEVGCSPPTRPQDVERSGMTGPSDTLGRPWLPLAIRLVTYGLNNEQTGESQFKFFLTEAKKMVYFAL